MNEWMNEWTNEWTNKWMNEKMNKKMNEQTNEWMNEYIREIRADCSYLAEHAGTTWCAGWFVWWGINAHGFSVTWEFQGEFLLPHLLDDMVAGNTLFTLVETRLVGIVVVNFLYEAGGGSLGGLPHLSIFSLSQKINRKHFA